ncbi:MAG: hypothetical protein KC731_01510 [Myxococcales bacterium]|nr:hypothetical protein [Myxococcales bacterium]
MTLRRLRRLAPLLCALVVLVVTTPGAAAPDAGAPCPPEEACPVELDLEGLGGSAGSAAPGNAAAGGSGAGNVLLFFWGVDCPHCDEARPAVRALLGRRSDIVMELVEVRRDAAGRARFMREVERLGISAPGVPTFIYGDRYLVGFQGDASVIQLEALLKGEDAAASHQGIVHLPLIGDVDPSRLSLPAFTLLVGLVDGINPCAMWVLLVLLGILTHVKSKTRLLLFGGAFVVMSGVVYFLFMTIWVSLFALMGLSRAITIVLGAVVLVMGLINLKETIWFKKGVSLVIPDAVKPKIYKRMRGITRAASLPAALLGVLTLAFFVNLIELGCTLGLPAIYTRVLTLRQDLGAAGRYLFIALYNLAYVVPLAIIVLAYAVTFHRMTLSERGAKILKGVSGVLLVVFGLILILAPELLTTT